MNFLFKEAETALREADEALKVLSQAQAVRTKSIDEAKDILRVEPPDSPLVAKTFALMKGRAVEVKLAKDVAKLQIQKAELALKTAMAIQATLV